MIAERTCIGCGKKQSKYAMLRIVYRTHDVLELDPHFRLPGRGAYLCPSHECLQTAIKRKALHRAFRTEIPASCYQQLAEYAARFPHG